VTIPVGQNFGYFDLIGLTGATPDPRLYYPTGVGVDTNGAVYVADYDSYRIRKLAGGVLSTIAGNGSSTAALGSTALTTALRPVGVTTDSAGNVYATSDNGHVVYQITPAGGITVVAGTQSTAGFADGVPGTGRLNAPYQVAIGPDGSIYIADFNNHRVRKIQSTSPPAVPLAGSMVTIAGGGATTPANSVLATAANLGSIAGVAVDPVTNEVYFSEYDNYRVWKFSQSTGQLVLIAGTGTSGYNGDQADATQAQLYYPSHLSINGSYLYIADQYNHRIRRVTTSGSTHALLTVAGTTAAGFNGDGDAAIVERLYYPLGVTTDAAGNVFIADQYNHRIREVFASDSTMQTIIGDGTAGFAGDGLPGRGVTITASIAPGGPTYLPITSSVNVEQSSWVFSSYPTNVNDVFNFTIRQTSPGSSSLRMNSSTTFSLTPSSANVVTLPATLTINNNLTSVQGSATTIGSGVTQIIAQASSTGIALGASSNITVTPVFSNVSPNNGPQNTTTPVVITGRNFLGTTSVTTTAPGITITSVVVSADGKTINANINVGAGATAGVKTITINTATGNPTFTFTVN
jgi:sugar lactone lactonase YvrE